MGGKKKTKWRKVLPEELSHITVKNSICEQLRNKKQHQSGDQSSKRASCSDSKERKCNGSDSRRTHQEEPAFPEGHEKDGFWNHSTVYEDFDDRSGFYINGLWIPVSELQNNTASSTASFPHSILRTAPFLVHQPSSFCPPTCPRFQTVHAPDVPLYPNYFIPSNNHYFYYLTRVQPRVDELVVDDGSSSFPGNEQTSICGPPWQPCLSDSGDLPDDCVNPTESKDEVFETTDEKPENGAISNLRDQEQAPETSAEQHCDPFSSLRFPGYTFGQPMYSVPFFPVLPSASVQLQPAPPWTVAHVQKKRRKRRKGYAEYAIIPAKKNSTSSLQPQHGSADKVASSRSQPNEISQESTEEALPTETGVTEKIPAAPSTEVGSERSKPKGKRRSRSAAAEKRLLLYAVRASENIVVDAKAELKQIFASQTAKQSEPSQQDGEPGYSPLSPASTENCSEIANEVLLAVINRVADSQPTGDYEAVASTPPKTHAYLHKAENKELPLSTDKISENATTTIHDVDQHSSTAVLNEELSEEMFDANGETMTANNSDIIKTEDDTAFPTTYLDRKTPSKARNMEVPSSPVDTKLGIDETWLSGTNQLVSPPIVSQPVSRTKICPSPPQSNNDNHLDVCSVVLQKGSLDDKAAEKVESTNKMDSMLNENDEQETVLNSLNKQFESSSENYSSGNESSGVGLRNWMHLPKSEEFKNNAESKVGGAVSENAAVPSPQFTSFPTVSSEALIRETELELSKLQKLSNATLRNNQSIYKLAYDESITDQSESEDTDPASQSTVVYEHTCMPSCKSLQNEVSRSEILVHEADSASDAGSEDVELLPHRYQSESVQNCNKHIYVNNLSLAVEMLRTHENLPYDEEFKRIVDDDVEKNAAVIKTTSSLHEVDLQQGSGRVNHGYIDEPRVEKKAVAVLQSSIHEPSQLITTSVSLQQLRECRTSIADSGVQSEDSEDEAAEEAKETFCKSDVSSNNEQWCSGQDATTSYRRFGKQTRQQFSVYTPRTGILNPCLCCIIM